MIAPTTLLELLETTIEAEGVAEMMSVIVIVTGPDEVEVVTGATVVEQLVLSELVE